MNQKLFFEDDSSIEITINIVEEGKMAKLAMQRLQAFLDEELLDHPQLTLQTENEFLELDEEDLEDFDEEEEDWLEEEEEDLEEDDWDEEEEDLDYDSEWVDEDMYAR